MQIRISRSLSLLVVSAIFGASLLSAACSSSGGDDDAGSTEDSGAQSDATSDASTSDSSARDGAAKNDAGAAGDGATIDAGAKPDCIIGDAGYFTGTLDPDNSCESCAPSITPSMWSAVADGTSCDAGAICNSGSCADGCEIGSMFYAPDAGNPSNACQTCAPLTSTSTWTSLTDGTGCGNGELCLSGVCGSDCDIDASVVASGATNASNVCESCQPGKSITEWTTTNGPNAGCMTGEVCNGSCEPGCWISTDPAHSPYSYYSSGAAANGSYGCSLCDPSSSTTSWTVVTGPASCPAGGVCGPDGYCRTGCWIAGTFYAPGATTNDACEVCDPTSSTTAWTNTAGFGTCATGQACSAGSCAAGCSINETFYASGATTNSGCETCNPSVSATEFTAVTDGTSCNGSQACGSGACGLAAVTVPFAPRNPSVPHPVLSGVATTVKGTALNGATSFQWDFGDGLSSSQTAVTDPNNLGVSHTYTGNVGQLFYAKLTVTNAASQVASAYYPVVIADPNDPNNPNLDIAVDAALWYVHTNLTRAIYAAGAPGYGQPYASSDLTGACAAMATYEDHLSRIDIPATTDPYSDDIRKLANYVFINLDVEAVPTAFDENGDGFGVVASSSDGDSDTMRWAACGQALSLLPNRAFVLPTGGAHVYGQPLSTVIQDLADYIAYAQNSASDGLTNEGGWGYTQEPQSSPFQSETTWAVVALAAYKKAGAVVPGATSTLLGQWLTSTSITSGSYCGSWDVIPGGATEYQPDKQTVAGALLDESFLGNALPESAIGFLHTYWNSTSDFCATRAGTEPYLLAKALRAYGVSNIAETTCGGAPGSTPSPFPWWSSSAGTSYVGISNTILSDQSSNGSWAAETAGGDCGTPSTTQETAWAADTLMGTAVAPRPIICGCNSANQWEWPPNSPVTLDGSCSETLDLDDPITAYAWDYNYNGSQFLQSVDPNDIPVAGVRVVKADGCSEYTTDASNTPFTAVFTVALLVTTASGATAVTTCNVDIKPPPYCPIANIGSNSGIPNLYYGDIGGTIQFDASASSQVDGDPLTYAWDFENLNRFTDSTLVNPTKTYTQNGTYPIELQVTNHPPQDAGAVPSCTRTVYGRVVIPGPP